MIKNIWISRETGIHYRGYEHVFRDYTKLMLKSGEFGGQEVPSRIPCFSKVYFGEEESAREFLRYCGAERAKNRHCLEVLF